jgi:four helix bundle protein
MTEMAVVVQKAYDWNLWILPKVEKFSKAYRFSIGQQLVQSSLDLLMNLVDASYQAKNNSTLASAVRNVNRVRYLIRLSKDLMLISESAYEFASKGLDEIGRMTGGWWKSTKSPA